MRRRHYDWRGRHVRPATIYAMRGERFHWEHYANLLDDLAAAYRKAGRVDSSNATANDAEDIRIILRMQTGDIA